MAVSPSTTAPSVPRKNFWTWRKFMLLIGLLAGLLFACLLLGIVVFAINASNDSPLLVSDLYDFDAPREYRLSDAQQALRDDIGDPDSFTILFYEDEFGGEDVRMETWIYSAKGSRYTWINGELDGTDMFGALTEEILPAPYRPEQFTAYMELEEVLGAIEVDEFLLLPLEKELVPGGESYFADRIMFGMKDRELLYVEAIGFTTGEEAADNEAEPPAIAETEPLFEDVNDVLPTPTRIVRTATPRPSATPRPATAVPPIATTAPPPVYPDAPILFVSDQDAANFAECRPAGDCWMQVFYNPAPHSAANINLTAPLGFRGAYSPVFSPDGRQIAFSGYLETDEFSHIYTVNLDGSELRQLTFGQKHDDHPAWSPDGSEIVYMSDSEENPVTNLWIVDVATTSEVQFTNPNGYDRHPVWSPDGQWISFHTSRYDPDPIGCWPNCLLSIEHIDLESEIQYSLLKGDEHIPSASPAWSPDGAYLAYHSRENGNYNIYVVGANDNSFWQLTDAPGDEYSPAFSPDGRYLIFSVESADGQELVITPFDEYDPIFFTQTGAFSIQPDW